MSNLRLDLLTDEELIEYQTLLAQVEIDNRWKSLRVLDEHTPKNYRYLFDSYYTQRYEGEKLVEGKKGVVLEGSARSAKTFSALKFICKVCTDSKEALVVNIIKETYNEFKTTLYKDFRIILNELGMDNPFDRLKEVDSFKINNSYVNFIGADNANKIHGNTSDIIYFNEVIPIDEGVFRQSIMRCSKFWIIDYNPSVTEHWVYSKVIPRPDVGYLRTTFRDNPLIPLQQKLEILAYEPFESGSYEIVNDKEIWYNGAPLSDTNQPPPHIENVQNGTADLFMWTVYGLGLRGAMQGVILRNVKYIDKSEVPHTGYIYGMDFGFTCFDGDTLIETQRGNVKIKNVTNKDYVLTRSGYKRVLNVFNNGIKEVVTKKISIFNTEIEISSTESHHFNINNKWKKYGELQKKDKLYVLSNLMEKNIADIQTESTKTTILESGKKKAFIMMKDCIMQFGSFIMGKYQKVCTFTTLTAMRLITTLAILCLLLRLNTLTSIASLLSFIKPKKAKRTETRLNTQKRIGEKGEQKLLMDSLINLESAINVISNTIQQTHTKSFAQLAVSLTIKKIAKQKLLKESVLFANQVLRLISILKMKVVQQNAGILWQSVEELNEVNRYNTNVYDLQVEDVHEYFANGILVHNCDPTSFHRYWQVGNRVYSELLCYRPIDNPNDIIDMMEQLDIEYDVPIICDSSDRYTSGNNGTVEMVLALQEAGYEAMKISKTKGVMYWLNLLRQCEVNVVVNELTPHVKKEVENYRFKEIQGILINQPIDRWNHWVDTLRYTYMAYNDNLEVETEWN